MKALNKKGNVMEGLGALGIGIATLTIVLVVAFLIQANVQDQIVSTQSINESEVNNYTVAYNASRTLQSATADIPGWVPLVVIVAIGGLVLGMIKMFKR